MINLEKTKSSSDESCSADQIAQNLIKELNSTESVTLDLHQILQNLKKKKHFTSKTFTKHIVSMLLKYQPSIQSSINQLLRLDNINEKIDGKKSQRISILEGYDGYWCKMKNNGVSLSLQLLNVYFNFSMSICFQVAAIIRTLGTNFNDEVDEQVIRQSILIIDKNMRNYCPKHTLSLIYHLNLYTEFETLDIVHVILSQKLHQIKFIFKDRQGSLQQQLIEAFIIKKLPKETQDLKKIIADLQLDPYNYPPLINTLMKNTLYYYRRQEEFSSIQLKIAKRRQLIVLYIQILIDEKEWNNAKHLINKYHIKQFYHLNTNTNYSKNKLEEYDRFKPTEIINGDQTHLTLKELGIKEKNVSFVDEEDKALTCLDRLAESDRFGIDCELIPVFHAFENKTISIMQISLQKQIYIFDVLKLKDNLKFRNRFEEFIKNYEGKIIGHTTLFDMREAIKQIGIQSTDFFKKLDIIDVADVFKYKFPETKKYSLKYITTQVLAAKLSKYEQCSGWDARPLRKCQLHYAALDAFLPLKLYDRLMEN